MKLPITLPFDKFISLTRTMFESNPLIVVDTQFDGSFESFGNVESYSSMVSHYTPSVTITSIEVRLPQFSIGDTVMIVDTGEIGKIDSKSMNYDWMIELQSGKPFVANNHELVKIPSDLLPILQD